MGFHLTYLWTTKVLNFDAAQFGVLSKKQLPKTKLIVMFSSKASLIAQGGKKICLQCRRPSLIPGLGRSPGEGISYSLRYSWTSLVAQLVKNLPSMRETWVQSLGWEDPLEKGKATHSSILAWRIPWTTHGLQRVRYDWATATFFLLRLLALSLGKTDALT